MLTEPTARPTNVPASAGSSSPTEARQFRNLAAPVLVEHTLARGEGKLADGGALVVETGEHTGRSPQDKFVVAGEPTDEAIWWGAVNRPMPAEVFDRFRGDVLAFLAQRDGYVVDCSVCADPHYATPVRVVTHRPWQAMFARAMFRPPAATKRSPLTVLHAPGFNADRAVHQTNSPTAIALSFERRLVIITGTEYAGEIKKSIFTMLQGLLPLEGVATMHCSANVGAAGDVALFFGLSGTGKTTLSTDGRRRLIGDDEHGWTDRGIFNFEGGSYAKALGLSPEREPQLYEASGRFGAILENVVLDPETRTPRFGDDALTENTRAAFPLRLLPGVEPSGVGDHPRNVLFLSADAFGVLPPVARLTLDQALFWFLLGYTARLAGTERGLARPTATFSACFGAPFLALPPARYATLLGERLRYHRPSVWLVNTGWTGGEAGVGERMPLALTRAIVDAALDGSLAAVEAVPDPVFGVLVPARLPGYPDAPLIARNVWQDPEAYDRAARRLVADIRDNFRALEADAPASVVAALPTGG